jgi:septum formation protein
MREIVLASKSKPRRKLLKQIGLDFRVVGSRVKERRVLKTDCPRLVIENALAKARDVAARCKKGVVVAADTVVLAEGRIIGKPRSVRHAFNTLKLLSRKPQWVYTGLAVIDIETGRIFTDYEKTKIYMIPMTDSDIRSYFRKTSPLDKAGSFDIQGLGGIFIDRIEGCFYNVVGMPLAKLANILKKINAI